MIIDHYGRGVEPLRRSKCRTDLSGENARLKSDGQAVGGLDRLIELGEPIDTGDRAKDLFARKL